MNVTYITTKWGIWQCVQSSNPTHPVRALTFCLFRAPYLLVLKDRGRTLRFYRPYQIPFRGDALREFLKVDAWKVSEPWSTAYAPGGERSFVILLPTNIPTHPLVFDLIGNISWNLWLSGSPNSTTASSSSPSGCSCSSRVVSRRSSLGSCTANHRQQELQHRPQ